MTTSEAGAPRALVVWCPDWPVVATAPDAGADRAVAVLESGRVLACSDAARAAGVRRGQRLRLAQRLCPDLELRDRDPEAETRLFEPVVAAVEAFTPRVEVLRPGMCAIPVKGPSRYFGGEEALAARIHTAVATALGRPTPEAHPLPEGVASDHPGSRPRPQPQPDAATPRSQVGVADGLFAAVLAARAAVLVPAGRTAEFLAPYPVAALGDEPLADLLVRLGIHTVGDFAELSGPAVADRFGPTGAAAHRRARGLQSRPLAPRPEGLDLTTEQLFDPPEQLAEPLVFVARTLAEQLHTRLGAVGLTCHRVAVEVTCADGRTASRLWRHEGRLGASALAERVRWQLQAWQSAATFPDEAGGFTALRLVPDGLVPDQGRQLALWGQAVAEDRVERAVARVQAVLGHAGLRRIEPAGGRGPGEQAVRVPWGEVYEAPAPAPWPGRLQDPPPSVVPRTPVPVAVLDAGGTPVTVSGRAEVSAPPSRLTLDGRLLQVTGWTGPWPAVEYWWDPARSRRRARFQVAVADGRALLLTVEGGHWSVEAAYD
ncbi:DNA polymerase Y family protein [Kitasatospora atroaurantiaca]|uniref:Protein ImuB n=1 Tax=Kitasatospora atroaurantiaca TaxID=285545 RepID=A0A561EL55_9ACTN|nr:DNA polymerase Y family protein [Kitasatospora atroaurantiaca]TWE16348.1 protein ImuB [Kitasatospora atroaurantiaca]